MHILIWAGAGLALVGVLLLVASGAMAIKVRRNADANPEAARAALSRVMFWNLGALAVGMMGLIVLILGLILT